MHTCAHMLSDHYAPKRHPSSRPVVANTAELHKWYSFCFALQEASVYDLKSN